MDSKRLDFGNDLAGRQGSLGLCSHHQPWGSCSVEGCREVWRLYQQSLDEDRKVKGGRIHARKAKKSRGNTESEFEIALGESSLFNHQEDDIGLPEEVDESGPDSAQRKLFRNIFPDEITIRAAVQFKALTPRQANLLKAYFDSDEMLPNYKRWDFIGQKIRCSGKTVERESEPWWRSS